MTLPHCTGCTEPGAVTHQQETVEHIHDFCGATIAALREALVEALVEDLGDDHGHVYRHCKFCGFDSDAYDFPHAVTCPINHQSPAAAKLLAERDAGRALYEAVRDTSGSGDEAVWEALEAYRKVVE